MNFKNVYISVIQLQSNNAEEEFLTAFRDQWVEAGQQGHILWKNKIRLASELTSLVQDARRL